MFLSIWFFFTFQCSLTGVIFMLCFLKIWKWNNKSEWMNFIQIESVDSKSLKNKAIDLLQKFISCAKSTTNITKKEKKGSKENFSLSWKRIMDKKSEERNSMFHWDTLKCLKLLVYLYWVNCLLLSTQKRCCWCKDVIDFLKTQTTNHDTYSGFTKQR